MNTRYKDSVFTLLFSSPDRLRELYNAISGSSFGPGDEVTINTLSDVLFMDRCNDISFTIGGKLVVLIEHQSTVNRNMPLRFLLYIARVYEKIIENKAVYRQKRVEIPRPEFIVLYNGEADAPDEDELDLSDSFAADGGKAPMLELKVKVYNVNEGHNEGIFAKSGVLEGYAKFIEEARSRMKGKGRDEALKEAIQYCIDHDILKDFLEEHSSEVINMLFTEWNWDDAKAVWQEEARQEATEKILTLVRQGFSADEIERTVGNEAYEKTVCQA
jgi:hypothetical protein